MPRGHDGRGRASVKEHLRRQRLCLLQSSNPLRLPNRSLNHFRLLLLEKHRSGLLVHPDADQDPGRARAEA